jgi:hypothetical protein
MGAKPIRQESELVGGNLSAADTIKQMIEQARRKPVASNSRHGYSP